MDRHNVLLATLEGELHFVLAHSAFQSQHNLLGGLSLKMCMLVSTQGSSAEYKRTHLLVEDGLSLTTIS